LFVSNSQVIGCEDCIRNDLYCVGWGVKLYSVQSNPIKKSNVLSTCGQYFAQKNVFTWCLNMSRLSAGSQKLSGSELKFVFIFTYWVSACCRFYHEPGTVAVTNGIKVSIATAFVPSASSIAPPHFSHAYRITCV